MNAIKAAKIVDINYSTAKTILFFYRNGEKSYQFEFQDLRKPETAPIGLRSEIVDLSIKHEEGTSCLLHQTIDIVSTIGSLNERLKKLD